MTDFGIAAVCGPAWGGVRLQLTRTSAVMGTPDYMAPEQRRDPVGVDRRADVYSAGVLLYEMLTGELPLGNFQFPSRKVAGLDRGWDYVVAKAIRPEPAERFSDMAEFLAAVEQVGAAGSGGTGPAVEVTTREMGAAGPPGATTPVATCFSCAGPLSGRERFCARCGEAVSVVCPRCKVESHPGSRFCTSCRYDLLGLLRFRTALREAADVLRKADDPASPERGWPLAEQALRVAESGLRQFPEDEEGRAFEALARKGMTDLLWKAVGRALAAHRDAEAIPLLTRLQHEPPERERATRRLEGIARARQAAMAEAERQLQEGAPDYALKSVQALQKRFPQDAEVRALTGRCEAELPKLRRYEQLLLQGHSDLAQAEGEGDPEERSAQAHGAWRRYSEAAGLFPKNPKASELATRAWNLMVSSLWEAVASHMRAGRDHLAVRLLTRLQEDPSQRDAAAERLAELRRSRDAILARAGALFGDGDAEGGLETLEAARQRFPDDPEVRSAFLRGQQWLPKLARFRTLLAEAVRQTREAEQPGKAADRWGLAWQARGAAKEAGRLVPRSAEAQEAGKKAEALVRRLLWETSAEAMAAQRYAEAAVTLEQLTLIPSERAQARAKLDEITALRRDLAGRVSALLSFATLGKARRLLNVAKERFGNHPDVRVLEREWEHLHGRFRDLVDHRVPDLNEKKRFVELWEVLHSLKEAGAPIPWLDEALGKVERRLARAGVLAREAHALLAAGDPAEARARAREALHRVSDHPLALQVIQDANRRLKKRD